ncbi:MAG: hypothetical protein AAGA18_14105 [Verrucomicrobiota bacterium]
MKFRQFVLVYILAHSFAFADSLTDQLNMSEEELRSKTSRLSNKIFKTNKFFGKKYQVDKKFSTNEYTVGKGLFPTKQWTGGKPSKQFSTTDLIKEDKTSSFDNQKWQGAQKKWADPKRDTSFSGKAKEDGKVYLLDDVNKSWYDGKKKYKGLELKEMNREIALINEALKDVTENGENQLSIQEIKEILNTNK